MTDWIKAHAPGQTKPDTERRRSPGNSGYLDRYQYALGEQVLLLFCDASLIARMIFVMNEQQILTDTAGFAHFKQNSQDVKHLPRPLPSSQLGRK